MRLLYQVDLGPGAGAGAEISWSARTPSLPRDLSAGSLVGVPLVGDPSLEVLEARVAATVRVPAGVDLPGANSNPLEGLVLDGPAALGRTGLLRRQRVAEVGFGPGRAAEGALTLYDRVRVEVRFPPVSGLAASPSDDRYGELLYQGALINSAQARAWRAPRPRPAARPAISQQAGDRRVR
ncbi:MAG: hypothetical protein ABIL09_22980, partial [Gemmatimonadota bacterium]